MRNYLLHLNFLCRLEFGFWTFFWTSVGFTYIETEDMASP